MRSDILIAAAATCAESVNILPAGVYVKAATWVANSALYQESRDIEMNANPLVDQQHTPGQATHPRSLRFLLQTIYMMTLAEPASWITQLRARI